MHRPGNELLNHILDCDKCPRQGSIANPYKEDYCDVGYDLLLRYIKDYEKVKHTLDTINMMKIYKK